MAAWVVVPCLLSLRGEFDQLAPRRDRGADGTIGDAAHTSTSDHTPDEQSAALAGKDADSRNEVHALDVDSTGPWPDGRSFAALVAAVIAGERLKWLDPDDLCRLEYVIFDRKIYSRQRDFAPVAYTGKDPHTNHAHFSARYITAAENDTRPWGVLPPPPKETAVAAVEPTTLLTSATNGSWVNRKVNAPNPNPDPTAAIVWLFAFYAAFDAKNIAAQALAAANAAKTSADAAAAAAQAAKAAVDALTHDPADGGNTAEQDSLKAALGL